MGIPAHVGTPIVFVGDSITFEGWFSAEQSTVSGTDLLADQLSPVAVQPRPGSVSGTVASATGNVGSVASVVGGNQIYAINSGVSGNKAADIAANVASRITNYNPQAIVLYVGVNDIGGNQAAFGASYASILSQITAWNPAVPVVCLSILSYGEQWQFPPLLWYSGETGTQIPQYNAYIQSAAASAGATYVNLSTAALNYEQVHNAPQIGAFSGILTRDGIHPLAVGQRFISDLVYPLFTFS